MAPASRWQPDILGEGLSQLTLPLGEDSEGEVVATLVRALPKPWSATRRAWRDVDVLYVHGWSDYFFQTRLARFWTERGARFFALDLRKYGRSLRPGQTPGYVADLATYDEDIGAALVAMGGGTDRGAPGRRLVLLGHSTGGLVLSLWADRHPDAAAAVILNSPWLSFQLGGLTRAALGPAVELQSRYRPFATAPQVDLGFYARAQREAADPADPLSPDPRWRPERSMAVHAGWLRAIFAGHDRVAAGLAIAAPVCAVLSARSVIPTKWSDDLTRADSVLVVDDVARAALRLGPSVTVERIEGALHDVFLSRPEARREAYRRVERWSTGALAR